MKEQVIHPEHYNLENRRECWDEMRDLFGDEAVAIFDVLSAYKYFYRKGNKDNNPEAQDLSKIDNYMSHCAELISLTDERISKGKKCFKIMRSILDKK